MIKPADINDHGEKLEISLKESVKRQLGFPLSPRSNSEDCFQLVGRWISECRNSHTICNQKRGKTRLPTRVIDVGPSDSSKPPYLLVSGGLYGVYATLSHRWGEISKQFTTTRGNVDDHKNALKLCNLPATFRDAIFVAKRLSI